MQNLVVCVLVAMLAPNVLCETIHFTNSPSHLMGSTNITSYKLLVKNSDPITIIEANKEVEGRTPAISSMNFASDYQPNDRIDLNVDDDAEMPFSKDYHAKLVANLGASHQVETKNTHDIREAIGITITGGPADIPSSSMQLNNHKKSDFDDGESDANSNFHVKKLVYSPVLLKKFVKEYTEKLKNADVGKKNEIQEIHEKIHSLHEEKNKGDGEKSENIDKKDDLNKPNDDVEEKYNYNNGYLDEDNGNRRRRPSDPYKDRDGWVTLEAVPWSSSSVSKWHPYDDHNNGDETRRRPSFNSARPYASKPTSKFPSYHDDDDDYYSRPKPSYIDRDSRPSVDRDGRPGVYTTWTKQSMTHNDNGRPKPAPYQYSESSLISSKYHDRNRPSSRPWLGGGGAGNGGGEIITDDRPSNFPSESHSHHYAHDDDDRYNVASSNTHSSYERPTQENNNANGEWVLISTTKGYQVAGGNRRQQGKRAMSFPSPTITIDVPQSIRMHKALKLTVLPALDTSNSTFSTDKKVHTITTHGGMLEIDGTHDSVMDDVRATLLAQQKPTTTGTHIKVTNSNTTDKRRKLLKGNSKLEERSE